MRKKISLILIFILVLTVMLTGCKKKDSNSMTNNENNDTMRDEKTDYSDAELYPEAEDSQEADSLETASVEEGYSVNNELTDNVSDTTTMKDSSTAESPMIYSETNTEEYAEFIENVFKDITERPLSTFSIDVDTASYTNLRKNINYGILPEKDAVRIEEMLNYFSYDYKKPSGEKPFSINAEIGKCPWNEENYLLTVGLQGKEVDLDTLPKSNLVFLIDVSGSMEEEDKLPLLKNAFSQLVEVLGENDRVSIVVYAGSSGVVIDGVPGNDKEIILDALNSLSAGGSTAGAEGIEKAYHLAEKNFIHKGNNRVILSTDGDFNVGPSSEGELESIIEEKRENDIFLSVIGFGSGNLKDNKMELLADKGNGNYAYIDSPKEAKKVLVDEMSGTLLTIAKDVKIQLEFNPYAVESYRLIGYENRALKDEDFEDDTVDAGELGAGHNVTAIYEIVPAKGEVQVESSSKELKYQYQKTSLKKEFINEILEVRLRYKEPTGTESKEIKQVVSFANTLVNSNSLTDDFYFAAAVAEFGMFCRDSEYKGNTTIDSILYLANAGLGDDNGGYRSEFVSLVRQYEGLMTTGW